MDLGKFQRYFNKKDAFSVRNGVRLTHLQKGYAVAEMDFAPELCNLMGTLHGGAYYTLADVAAGSAVIPYGKLCVTLSADIHYLRPPSGGTLKAKATVVQRGERIAVCKVDIEDEAEKLLCVCNVTMYQTSKDIPEEFED
jgi:acyl-CoA thioesterase